MKTSEKHTGKTPHSGDYSIVYYLDDNNNPVVKDRAVRVRICEYTNDGNRVMETYATIQKQTPDP